VSIHRSYCWSVDTNNAFAEAPSWLLSKLETAVEGAAIAPEQWNDLVHNGVGEGGRNVSITRLAGHLLQHWVDPYIALGLLQSWNATHCRPPLSEKEIDTIVNSICLKELQRRRRR
jgi:Primase C terminal 1 (PriCT-1)